MIEQMLKRMLHGRLEAPPDFINWTKHYEPKLLMKGKLCCRSAWSEPLGGLNGTSTQTTGCGIAVSSGECASSQWLKGERKGLP